MPLYRLLKQITKQVLPERWLFRYEPAIRKLFALSYRGKQFHCNICQAGLSKFVELPTGDLLCPFCGSLPRNRRLWELLQERGFLKGRVLDFSPPGCLYRIMENRENMEYLSTDFAGEFRAHRSYDITRIEEPDSSFDLIICFHVLEHVEDDGAAMRELFRVLKKNGKALIQTPFREGDIFEDNTIRSPEDRLKFFGQKDHVRVYSVEGLKARLAQAGFSVEVWGYPLQKDLPVEIRKGKAEGAILIASR